jgi:hypothetical protein
MTALMTIKYETWTPQHRKSDIGLAELDSIYEQARAADSPTFTWNDLGDDVLVVAVGDDYSVVSMLTQNTWFFLRGPEAEGDVDVVMAGHPATVPKCAVLERGLGLEVLRRAVDFPNLLSSHSWLEQ